MWKARFLAYLRTRTDLLENLEEVTRLARIVEWEVDIWLRERSPVEQMILALLVLGFLLMAMSISQGFDAFLGRGGYARVNQVS